MKKITFSISIIIFCLAIPCWAKISPAITDPLSPIKEKGNIATLLLDGEGGYVLLFPDGEGIYFEKEEAPPEWEQTRPLLHGQKVAVEIKKEMVGTRINKNFSLNFLEPTVYQILESLTPPE